MKAVAIALAALVLAGCGGEESVSENAAERLEEAAEYSTDAAANVIENSAEALREADPSLTPAESNAIVQQTMDRAGDAQVSLPAEASQEQAKPREPGDPRPPPTIPTNQTGR